MRKGLSALNGLGEIEYSNKGHKRKLIFTRRAETLKKLGREQIFLFIFLPSKTSVCSVLSWASSRMTQPYCTNSGSLRHSMSCMRARGLFDVGRDQSNIGQFAAKEESFFAVENRSPTANKTENQGYSILNGRGRKMALNSRTLPRSPSVMYLMTVAADVMSSKRME